MSSKAIKRKAAEHLGYGLSKQQAYDVLMAEFPDARPKKVADILRYQPTLQARERFRTLHLALLTGIVVHAMMRIVPPLLQVDFVWENSFRFVSLVPIASVLLGWSVWHWEGQAFQWVGWMNVAGALGMLKAFTALNNGGGDVSHALLSSLSVGIGVIALHLAYKVFAKPKVEKDALDKGVVRVVFPEEGAI